MSALPAIVIGRARALACLALTLPSQAIAADRELGQYLASQCAACHQAEQRQSGIPAIVGLPPDQFTALMGAYRDRQRENPAMQAVAARLSPDEIAALAAYYGSLGAAR